MTISTLPYVKHSFNIFAYKQCSWQGFTDLFIQNYYVPSLITRQHSVNPETLSVGFMNVTSIIFWGYFNLSSTEQGIFFTLTFTFKKLERSLILILGFRVYTFTSLSRIISPDVTINSLSVSLSRYILNRPLTRCRPLM